MKSKRNTKTILTNTLIVSFISVSLISCDWIINKKDNNESIFGASQTRIETNKDEAKLLVLASQNNLDVIELCQVIKDVEIESETNIKHLANDLEKTHIEIFNEYKELAREKLISIPQRSNIDSEIAKDTLNKKKEIEFIEENLELITEKMSDQIELLKELYKTTNNKEFRSLSKKTNSILKSKLVKTQDSLNKLKNIELI